MHNSRFMVILVALCAPPCVSTAPGQAVSFLPPVDVPGSFNIKNAFANRSLAAGDLNADGKADLVVLRPFDTFPSSPIDVYIGNGDGTFRFIQSLAPPRFVTFYSPVLADFNGDKKLDLIVMETRAGNPGSTPSVVVFPGNGDGTFGAPLSTPVVPQDNSNGLLPITVLDFNRDGHPDAIAGQNVLAGNGDGTFRALASLDSPAWLSADFNSDGNADLLVVPAPGQLALAFGRGDGTFAKGIAVGTPFPAASWVIGDFNGDGRIDLAISPIGARPGSPADTTAVSNLAVLRGNGDGSFQTPLITGNAAGPILATADMNGDGKLDLIVGNSVLAGLGNGTFRFPVFFGVATPPCFPGPTGCQVNTGTAAIVSDLNGDGAPDVIEAYSAWTPFFGFSVPGLSLLLNDSPGDGFLVNGVSSATYKWPAGAVSLVTAFGNNLAPATQAAPDTTAPPTTLGGIRIHLRDRTTGRDSTPTPERLAPLFYVSPNQINFEVSTTDTSVYVGIERVGFPYTAKGMVIPVQPVAADLFTLNSAGLAAASAVRVSASGNLDPVLAVSCSGAFCAAVPIDVGGNPVYLSLYGTGFDSSSPRTDTVCTVGGLSIEPSYSGRQLQIPGLDQINLLLPSSLAGRGDMAIQCSVGSGVTAVATGVLHVTIQ